ncbi:unnamed protein product [Phytophthora lilii]|uniref:Unnamed protein product n=1 Tax=Phytophthora lilii TaxID=2077276 RepID=A0A9W6TJV9_9STRA|nr:unnamed protein product [Phytophthora lilii]
MCARQAPELFRGNNEFAVRGIEVLRAAAEADNEQSSDLRSEACNEKELQHIATYLEFLRDFLPSAVNTIRLMVLYRKLEILNVTCWTNSSVTMELLSTLVEYIKNAGGHTLNALHLHHNGSCGFKAISQFNHDEIIRKSLKALWSSNIKDDVVLSAVHPHIDSSFLEEQHALTMIQLGKGELSVWTAKLADKSQQITSQVNLAKVTFCESNPTYFLPEDPLRIYVRTRNVKTLTAHLYEIKTMEYYSRLRREIKGDICLDGLLPTEEQVIDLSHFSPWQEARVPVEFVSTSNTQRGVFVVEVFEKGITCRAILRKGFLRHVERITTRGHEFTVLDEHGAVLRDASALILNVKSGGSRAQHSREYEADEDGSIVIPFRHSNEVTSSDKFAIIFCYELFGNFHGSFNYLTESFDVDIDMHVDTEQLLPGSMAQLTTRPRLLAAGLAISGTLAFLVNAELVIEFNLINTNNVGSNSHKEVISFPSMQHVVDNPPCFEIPMDAEGFNVTLSACVFRAWTGEAIDPSELPKVSDSQHFDVQRVNSYEGTYTAHLTRRSIESGNPYSPSEFRVLVLGHNGEVVPNAPANFTFKHIHTRDPIVAALQSDTSGEINLGQLQDVQQLSVELGVRAHYKKSCSWEMPNLRSYRPQIVNCSTEEVVEIPIPFAYSTNVETWVHDKLVSVCKIVDSVLQQASNISDIMVVRNNFDCPISIAVQIRRAGKYVIYLRPLNLKYPVTVCEKKQAVSSLPLGLIIQPAKVLLATRTLPLTICSQVLKAKDDRSLVLQIQLRNAAQDSTHVLVLLKHFLDPHNKKVSEVIVADGLTAVTTSGVRLAKLSFPASRLENDFLKMRKISDEYAYILQRRALASANQDSLLFLGSTSLPKPSLLQNPHVVSESEMEVVTVEAGDKVTGFKSVVAHDIQSGGISMRKKKLKRSTRTSSGSGNLVPSISFLGQQSHLLSSSFVDANGMVQIELDNLPFFSSELGSFEVCTLVFDCETGCVCTQELAMTVPGRKNKLVIPKRDIRLSLEDSLAPSDHFHQVDGNECIRRGDIKTLPRTFSSRYALYESLESAINLWPTLTGGSDVAELANKLKGWSDLHLQEKTSFYYANACDDLHFYLFRKDPDFFKQYAKPLVAAKICKSLVDYYVLGDDANLRRFYSGPAPFQQLSCVEKLLIAERLTSLEETGRICQAVIRDIESSNASRGSTTLARMFNTVLSQGQVEVTTDTSPSSREESMAFGAPPPLPRALPRQRQQQQQLHYDYSPTSPAYSPTSPAYAPAGFSYACAAPAFRSSAAFGSTAASVAIDSSETAEITETTEECLIDYYDDDFGVRSLNSESDESDSEGANDDDEDDSEEKAKKTKKLKQETPYIPPGKVRKVQEKRYFAGQRPVLTGKNMFWKEYAEHILHLRKSSGGPEHFVSSYFPEALVSITEGIFALAVLELDNNVNPTQVQLSSTGSHVTLSPTSDAVLYHRSIGPAQCVPTANSVLIVKQRIEDENGDFNTELLVNKIYTTVVTLSNIGADHFNGVNLLLQIPQGALPMGTSGFYTKSEIGSVAPNHTAEFRFSFYFPEEGRFAQYPARASVDNVVVGWANLQDNETTYKLVRSATRVNLASWTDVSARGSLQDVLQFMELSRPGVIIDHQKVFWRCHDEVFFRGIIKHFRSKLLFVSGIWKYGLLHRDAETMKEFFASSSDLTQSLGSGFRSSFVDESRLYHNERFGSAFERFDHCEFGPFLTRRVHPVTGKVDTHISWGTDAIAKSSGKRILNGEARQYFGELCQRLGTHTRMDGPQLLVMAYYMIIFDRIDDAISIFSRLERLPASTSTELRSTVQYAYLAAFLDFFRTNNQHGHEFDVARRAILRYKAHPQPRWKQRFQKMHEFIKEYDAFDAQKLSQLEDTEMVDAAPETSPVGDDDTTSFKRGSQVTLDANVDHNVVTLLSRSLGQCELSFYPIDVELMFSTEPFNTFSDSAASASSLLLVEPRQHLSIDLQTTPAEGLAKTTVPIPSELRSAQMMIRIRESSSSRTVRSVAPPIDIIRPYFNSMLNVDIMTQCGLLQVLHAGLPVRSCYVKVYAKVSSAGNRIKSEFYKDGYTDLLGKFDYVGINGDLLTSVQKFSILISHEKYGASVEQADPPVLAATVGDFSGKEERESLLY